METKSSRLDIRCEIVYTVEAVGVNLIQKAVCNASSLAEDGSKPLLSNRRTMFSSIKETHTYVYVKCVTMLLALPNGD